MDQYALGNANGCPWIALEEVKITRYDQIVFLTKFRKEVQKEMSEWIKGRPDILKPGMVIETPDAKGAYLVGDICTTVCTLDKISRYKLNKFLPDEHNCGVVDDRESSILMHQILAEIRKSNAPSWVAEELQKKFDCQRCWLAFRRYSEALYHTRLSYQSVSVGSERSKTDL